MTRTELVRHPDASASEVVGRILTRLREQLGRLIGSAGYDALLARAVFLARRADPPLAGVTVAPGGGLAGLDEATYDGDVTRAPAMAVIGQLVELLIALIGEDLAMQLARDFWPAVAEDETNDDAG